MLEGRDLDAADAERWTRILRDAPSPVLHVGAGSGRALTSDLEQAAGVEADAELAALAQREGRDVVGADPRSYVASLPENGIGCALVTGLTEELEGRELNELVTGLARSLRPDGLLVLDALDPRDPGALGELWRDPRRSRLLHPDAAMAIVDSAGFTGAVVSEVEGSTPRRYEVHARA
jgi:O-antigen chain-terminating methyltransferase